MSDEELQAPPKKDRDTTSTREMPALTDRALLEDVARQSRSTGKTVDRLEKVVDVLYHSSEVTNAQVGAIKARVEVIETKFYRIENPSRPPPAPLTSERVRQEAIALIESHPSQMDLDAQAAQAKIIIRQNELEAAIHETRATTEKTAKVAEATAEAIQKQSDIMGIGKKGIEWLRSKEAKMDVVRIVTLFGVAYVALKQMGILK